jgi:alkanesulfonate monooxygenase SsuD/methylene tetrahydromethanopterin reductase-like flavin-dependent oxidoreductase (luciferase family)
VRKNDYLASGTDFHRRGRSSERQYELLRKLWSGEPLSSDTGVIGPAALRRGGPELLIGGYVPAIVQRIAKWGDGYMAPGGGEPEALLHTWRNILQAWKDHGRAGQPRWVGASYFALGPNATEHATEYVNHNYGYNPELAAKRLRTLPASDEAVRTAIQRQADMGVDEFILRPCAEDLEQMERLAEIAAKIH